MKYSDIMFHRRRRGYFDRSGKLRYLREKILGKYSGIAKPLALAIFLRSVPYRTRLIIPAKD
jgi:hypothetical protein